MFNQYNEPTNYLTYDSSSLNQYNYANLNTALPVYQKWAKLHFKSPTAERRHASCVGGWRGSNPRRPAPMEQGMPALTSRLLLALLLLLYKIIYL